MNIHDYLQKFQPIHKNILYFLDHDDDTEENYQNLLKLFEDQKIKDNRQDLLSLLKLLIIISKYHYRYPCFFNKIEKIILFFKKDIINHFSNYEIFHTFSHNKRILLFIFQEKLVIFDTKILKELQNKLYYYRYIEYFTPEIKQFIDAIQTKTGHSSSLINDNLKKRLLKEIPEDFNEKRKEGNNHNYICTLIQKDSIEEFIIYVNKTNYSLSSYIVPSIFETNNFLIIKQKPKQKIKLIEYASFYGSIQIIKYLIDHGIQLESSLWFYAVYSDNPELIQILEENNILPDNSYKNIIEQSIICHHNDIVRYIQNNHTIDNFEIYVFYILKYYNFELLEERFIKGIYFVFISKCEYYYFVEYLLKYKKVDINQPKIFLYLFIIFYILIINAEINLINLIQYH